MSGNFKKTLLLCGSALLCISAAGSAAAQDSTDKIDVRSQLIFQYITEDSRDLGTGSDDTEDSFSEQLQTSVRAKLNPDTTVFTNVRALNINGDAGFDDDTGQTESLDQSFLELRELWLERKNLFGVVPLGVKVGRQRLQEPRALWWNQDLNLVKVNYDSTLLKGFLATGEEFSSFRTSGEDANFQAEDEERFRILGELSSQYTYNHFLEGRFLYEDDHSDTEAPGTVISDDDFDEEDLQALWIGARAAGIVEQPVANVETFKYRADLIGLFGEEDLTASTPGAPGFRTVAGTMNNDVRAWAFDGGAAVVPDFLGGTVLSAGYAFGSGDDDPSDDTDNEFRQTDIQGLSSRTGLERQQQRNYGEVLRPELSNIHIASASAAYPLSDNTDIGLTYFNYHLAEDATSLRSSGIRAPLNGTDRDIGQALDLAINVGIDDEFGLESKYINDIDARAVIGSFFPGDAYEPDGDHEAFRIFTELKFRF